MQKPKNTFTRIYDGADYCSKDCCCPVADFNSKGYTVTIHDPAKPENGRFTMLAEEFNLFLKYARPVDL